MNNKKQTVTYEQFIAGALLKFDSIDSVDYSLLTQDLKKQTKIETIEGVYAKNIGKYIRGRDIGIISLKDGLSLDDFIEEENTTLREILLEASGNVVNDYFNHLDVDKYKEEKETDLSENKEKVLNTANVLLISDIEEDYDALVKYGFKNVDYFKSIIRADKYFDKHPEKLKKYNIILKGNQSVQHCCFEGRTKLDSTIDELGYKKNVLTSSLSELKLGDCTEFFVYLKDNINYRYWHATETTYPGVFDRIVENTFINHTLDNVDLKNQKFIKHEDYINPNRLLPRKKSDLKILYLEPFRVSEFANRISQELGLDITFKEDNNYSLGRDIKSHLGDYDIFIVSNTYSYHLLGMNVESTEQCKDTGRDLTLLTTYDEIYWRTNEGLGNDVKLNYTFGGNIAPDSKCHSTAFRVLRKPVNLEGKDEYWKKQAQSRYCKMRATIEASVNIYNEALKEMGKITLNDLDLNTASEFESEYTLAEDNKRKQKEAELAPITAFDNIRDEVLNYLEYRKNGLISEEPAGLKITEGKDGIKLENIYQGKTYCSIIFRKSCREKQGLRVFSVQTLSKKGILSNPQIVGLYTKEYESLDSVPNRPNENQSKALASIEKKVNVALKPLNEEALNKKQNQRTKKKQNLRNRKHSK